MLDFDRTVISQYSNSPVICQMIANINAHIDPSYDLEQFYNLIWNIDTAVGYGLDVWGRIVGINRVITIASNIFLGFQGLTGASGDSFNVGIFYEGETLTSNYALTDDSYRRVILAKAAANITNGSIPALNQILLNLFPGRGNCYVQDNGDMTMVYVFTFTLTPVEISIISPTYGLLPTPTGVLATLQYPS